MTGYILKVNNLTKKYKNNILAVDNISFKVPKGICFGLLGPNGAGKTTTIEIMEGILEPTAGSVLFLDKPIGKHFKEKVGIQFQNTSIQDFLSVRDILKLFASLYPKSKPLDEIVEICSLADIIHRDTKTLSGGQRQRMLLSLALINDPEVLFLDEPTTGLDPQARRNFWELVNNIKREKKTIILTTHYMDEAEYLCEEVAIMDQGRIIAHDKTENLLKNHFKGFYVNIPYRKEYDEKIKNLPWPAADIDGMIQFECDEIEKLILELQKNKISLNGLKVKAPGLEDLFLKITGTSLRS